MRGNRMFDPRTWLPRRQPQRSRRSFVPANDRDTFDYHPEAQQILQMDPLDFLDLAVSSGRRLESILDGEVVNRLVARMKADQEIDPPFLVVNCHRVVAHNGRHRAWAAHLLGLNRIPVVVFVRNGSSWVDLATHPEARIDPKNPNLLPQFEKLDDDDDESW